VKSIPSGPFQMGAVHYLEAGWRPLPLPAGKKHAPPSDWTGATKKHSNETPDRAQLAQWAVDYPQGNLAISPPKVVLGIDVDAYESKSGAATFLAAQEEWGTLPETWVSTSRPEASSDAKHLGIVSGIRWYHIPEGLAWPGKLPQGGGIELVRWDHRYAVVVPSIHPEGMEYCWIRPDGIVVPDEFPTPEELPALPDRWIDALTSGRREWVRRDEVELDPEEVQQWIEDRGDHEQCAAMDRTARKHLQELRKAGPDGGAHEQMLTAVWAVIGDAAAGHKGVRKALDRIKLAFWEASKDRRSKAEAASEWSRALSGGVQKVVAEGDPEDDDLCELDQVSRAPKERRRVGATDVWPRNDTGNAKRFAQRYRDSVRWVAAFDAWFIWSDRLNVWAMDRDGEAMRMAQETAATISQEAEFEEDPKVKSAIRKFATASANEGKLKAMLGVAKTLKGMSISADALNSRRDLLVCPNGTLELQDPSAQVRLRPSRLEDYNTISTGTDYRADATLPEWEKFLERFQPDLEIREWLQIIAGYSLLGRNPKRVMAVAFGYTSTGKTTFANAMAFALGEYAASTTMTVFRDNQDERPRPDLVRVLEKRFAYAEEASASWRLHPDQIKRVTGGAPVTARVPYAKEYMEVQPAFTPWLLTNHAPTIEGADAALQRRVVVIPFDVQIPKNEEDPAFEDLLKSQKGREAVLAWLVEGYQKYLDNPDAIGVVPMGAIEPMLRFWSEVSDMATALQEICEYGEPDEYRVLPQQLFQAYLAWCTEHGVKENDRLNGTRFGRELNGLGFTKKSVRLEGKPVQMRVGIRLKREWVKALGVG
jgi:P4 family phage/plasmid primase-like protien